MQRWSHGKPPICLRTRVSVVAPAVDWYTVWKKLPDRASLLSAPIPLSHPVPSVVPQCHSGLLAIVLS